MASYAQVLFKKQALDRVKLLRRHLFLLATPQTKFVLMLALTMDTHSIQRINAIMREIRRYLDGFHFF